MSQKIFVIAGNIREFEEWCRQNIISKHSPLLKYVSDINDLRGTRNPVVYWIGTFGKRRDFQELSELHRYLTAPPQPKIIYVGTEPKKKQSIQISHQPRALVF